MSLSEGVLRELRGILSEAVLTAGDTTVAPYAHDMVSDTRHHRPPEAVAFPVTTQEVTKLVCWSQRHGIPITSRGAGSGLAGGAIAAEGGIVCSLERMDRIVELDSDDLSITVEPGVVTRDLDGFLREHGLFFAGYPMSEEICTIGGNVATNAGGGRAVKYGVTANHVIGLQVVIADGEILNLGGSRRKDVTGLNLLPLFLGSEGILGIITRITLRLTPRPVARLAFLCGFPDRDSAVGAVAELRRATAGVPSSIEYIDGRTARGTAAQVWRGRTSPISIGEETAALLLVEAEGADHRQCSTALKEYAATVTAGGATVLITAESEADLDQVWKLRKAVPWWVKRQSGPYHSVEDVVVPTSRIPKLVDTAAELEQAEGLTVAVFGHAGDGNFHINPMKPAHMTPERWDQVLHSFLDGLYRTAVSLGGTISGEHGIGRKRVYALGYALSSAEIAVMQRVKDALDPQNLFNPGVLLP